MLTNKIREHFGLKKIDISWKKFELKGLRPSHYILIDESNVIQKLIYPQERGKLYYQEIDYEVPLDSQSKIIGKRGKIQPLTYSNFIKIKPGGKSFEVNNSSLKLINYINGVQLFNEYDLNWSSEDEVLNFLNEKILSRDNFFLEELKLFLTREKQVNQKVRQGDIFRVKLAGGRFAYGRVIANLEKFLTHQTLIVSEWSMDWRGRNVFNEILRNQMLVDFFEVITENPYLKYSELKEYPTTNSVCTSDWWVKHESYIVIDKTQIEASSFDLPMNIDTFYQSKTICHIFKWGAGVVTFEPDDKVEELMRLHYHENKNKNKNNYLQPNNKSAEEYINSCLKGLPEYSFLDIRGDIRSADCRELLKIISEHLDFDLKSNDYDGFAKKYGFMDRKDILEFTK